MRALFERGGADGTLRTDLSADAQLQLFASAIAGALQTGLQRELGLEQAVASVTSYFLAGACKADARENPGASAGPPHHVGRWRIGLPGKITTH